MPRAVRVIFTSSAEDKNLLLVCIPKTWQHHLNVTKWRNLNLVSIFFPLGTLFCQMDIQKLEDEQNLKFRGFREVIDLVASSEKPIISYNCLNGMLMHH